MTPIEALNELETAVRNLRSRPGASYQSHAIRLIVELKDVFQRQERSIETLYNNVVVLNAFLGATRPLN